MPLLCSLPAWHCFAAKESFATPPMPSSSESHLRLVDHEQPQNMLATLVHDLRNPLYAISVYVEMLTQQEAGPLTAAQRELLQRIRHNCQELERLLTAVLPSPAVR